MFHYDHYVCMYVCVLYKLCLDGHALLLASLEKDGGPLSKNNYDIQSYLTLRKLLIISSTNWGFNPDPQRDRINMKFYIFRSFC